MAQSWQLFESYRNAAFGSNSKKQSHLRKELEGWDAQIGNPTQAKSVGRNSFEEFSRLKGRLGHDVIVMDVVPYQDLQKIDPYWDLCSSLFGLTSEETSPFLFLYCYNFKVSASGFT